jgi:hypothetical protein
MYKQLLCVFGIYVLSLVDLYKWIWLRMSPVLPSCFTSLLEVDGYDMEETCRAFVYTKSLKLMGTRKNRTTHHKQLFSKHTYFKLTLQMLAVICISLWLCQNYRNMTVCTRFTYYWCWIFWNSFNFINRLFQVTKRYVVRVPTSNI